METNKINTLFTDMTAEESATVNGGCYYSYSSYYYKPSYSSSCGYYGYGYKKASYYGGYKGYARYCY